MMFGLVASIGLKMSPVCIDAGVKINTEVYIGILKDKVLPCVKANFSADQYVVLQQDGAPCHTSNRTQQWPNIRFGRMLKHEPAKHLTLV